MYSLFKGRSNLATFRGFYEIMITEGYFATYSVDKLFRNFKEHFKDRIRFEGKDVLGGLSKTKYGVLYTFELFLATPMTEEDYKYLRDILNLFGYYISSKADVENEVKMLIEPRSAVDVSEIMAQLNPKVLYHITVHRKLERIFNIGLTPREPETEFFHPDDRIYLLYTKDDRIIDSLAMGLARNHFLTMDKMVVLSIEYDKDLKYYLDDTTTNIEFDSPYLGCYVIKNIRPDKIKVYKEYKA